MGYITEFLINEDKMKIITLVGKDRTRKTTLIKRVYNEILKEGLLLYYESEGADNQDFKALIKWNDKIIAFCSIGDPADPKHIPSEYILRGLVFASKKEADILVNAYSKSFRYENNIEEFSYETYESIISVYKNNSLYIPIKIDDNAFREQFDENCNRIIEEISK